MFGSGTLFWDLPGLPLTNLIKSNLTLIKWERTWIAWYGRNEGGGGFVKEHEEHEPAYSDSSHCMQAEAGYRAHPKWDLPIWCSSEYLQSNQLMIVKTTDVPRLLAELQATACQKQCYAKIFQHFQQLAQCFSPLWFCSFQILCTQTHSWIHLIGQALTVKTKSDFKWKLLKNISIWKSTISEWFWSGMFSVNGLYWILISSLWISVRCK